MYFDVHFVPARCHVNLLMFLFILLPFGVTFICSHSFSLFPPDLTFVCTYNVSRSFTHVRLLQSTPTKNTVTRDKSSKPTFVCTFSSPRHVRLLTFIYTRVLVTKQIPYKPRSQPPCSIPKYLTTLWFQGPFIQMGMFCPKSLKKQ